MSAVHDHNAANRRRSVAIGLHAATLRFHHGFLCVTYTFEMKSNALSHAIVAHDGRPESDAAVLAGSWLCQIAADAELHLRHSVDLPAVEDLPGPPPAAVELRETALRKTSEAIIDHLRKLPQNDLPAGYGNNLRVVAGSPREVLGAAMKELADAVLVVGPHERAGWIDMGSTLRALLRDGVRPIWRQRQEWQAPRLIVLAADQLSTSAEAVRMATTLAQRASIPLEVVHAHQLHVTTLIASPLAGLSTTDAGSMERERKADEEAFAAWFQEQELPAGTPRRVELGRPSEVLIEQSNPETLLVMGSGGKNVLEDLFVGSTSYEVLAKATGPVLVV